MAAYDRNYSYFSIITDRKIKKENEIIHQQNMAFLTGIFSKECFIQHWFIQ